MGLDACVFNALVQFKLIVSYFVTQHFIQSEEPNSRIDRPIDSYIDVSCLKYPGYNINVKNEKGIVMTSYCRNYNGPSRIPLKIDGKIKIISHYLDDISIQHYLQRKISYKKWDVCVKPNSNCYLICDGQSDNKMKQQCIQKRVKNYRNRIEISRYGELILEKKQRMKSVSSLTELV